MRTTQELVSAAQQGEKAAFAELVRLYERAAVISAYSVLGDFHAAQDATQDAFVTAYQKLAQLRDGSAFGPWLLTTVRRQAISMRQKHVLGRSSPELLDETAAQTNEWAERHQEVFGSLARLPEHERIVVVLRYVDGHSVQEIAAATGRPLGTVTKQLSRAVERLRTWLIKVQS